MYTLFTNEKLGMLVEGMRLADIRQQIDGHLLADAVQTANSDYTATPLVERLARIRAWRMAPYQNHCFTQSLPNLLWYLWNRNKLLKRWASPLSKKRTQQV